jgi:hypothetical protein
MARALPDGGATGRADEVEQHRRQQGSAGTSGHISRVAAGRRRPSEPGGRRFGAPGSGKPWWRPGWGRRGCWRTAGALWMAAAAVGVGEPDDGGSAVCPGFHRPPPRDREATRLPPVFSSPAPPGWDGDRFGFYPGLRTPRLPAAHARAETGQRALARVPHLGPKPNLQQHLPLDSCTLTSHELHRRLEGQPPRRPDIFALSMWHWDPPKLPQNPYLPRSFRNLARIQSRSHHLPLRGQAPAGRPMVSGSERAIRPGPSLR